MEKKNALKGKDLMLWVEHYFYVDGREEVNEGVISLSTDCSINLQPVTTEADSKDSEINDIDIEKFTWTAQNTSQLTANDAELLELKKFMEAKRPVNVIMAIPEGNTDNGADYIHDNSSNGYMYSTDGLLQGNALITSIAEAGSVNGKATVVVTLQGIGELTPWYPEPMTRLEIFKDLGCTNMTTTGETIDGTIALRITPMPTGSSWAVLEDLIREQYPDLDFKMIDGVPAFGDLVFMHSYGQSTFYAFGPAVAPFGQIFVRGFEQEVSRMSLLSDEEPQAEEEQQEQ